MCMDHVLSTYDNTVFGEGQHRQVQMMKSCVKTHPGIQYVMYQSYSIQGPSSFSRDQRSTELSKIQTLKT